MRNINSTFSIGLHVIAIAAISCLSGQAQDAAVSSPTIPHCEHNLCIHLSSKQAVFETGQSVPIRIEMQNCGDSELWIALSYEEDLGFPANLILIARDLHRRKVLPKAYMLLGGFGKPPYEWWVRLPPGYMYGRDVSLTQHHSSFVSTPGTYEIAVSYTGISRPQISSGHSREPLQGPREGSNVFTGRIESNAIQIQILSKSGP
jgi:hypothetical protein